MKHHVSHSLAAEVAAASGVITPTHPPHHHCHQLSMPMPPTTTTMTNTTPYSPILAPPALDPDGSTPPLLSTPPSPSKRCFQGSLKGSTFQKRISILVSTGSISTQMLDIVNACPNNFCGRCFESWHQCPTDGMTGHEIQTISGIYVKRMRLPSNCVPY